ncbi:MAG: radical SAM protein [Oligoflexus sp.]
MTTSAPQKKNDQTYFCNAPFAQMLLAPTGKIHPCCFHFGYTLGQSQQDWQELWNGGAIRKLRREFMQGKVKTCRSRIFNLACHKNFAYLDDQVEIAEYQQKQPLRLDIRLNGRCNLSCVMCDVWQQPNRVYDESFFWQKGPQEIFPYLREIDVLGGEPFIQKDTFRLIRLMAKINPAVAFSFVTNANYAGIQRIFTHLDYIRLKSLQISLDAMSPSVYQKVRASSQFTQVLENAEKYARYRHQRQQTGEKIQLKFSFCVLQHNWQELPQFFEYCHQQNATPELQFAFYDPSQRSSLFYLPTSELTQVYDYLQKACQQRDQLYLESILRPIRQRLFRQAPPHQ